jgi:hypothetical protein
MRPLALRVRRPSCARGCSRAARNRTIRANSDEMLVPWASANRRASSITSGSALRVSFFMEVRTQFKIYYVFVPTRQVGEGTAQLPAILPHSTSHYFFFTFFGEQRSFFFAATTPQSLQRKSPGLAFRIGVPLRQPMLFPTGPAHTARPPTQLIIPVPPPSRRSPFAMVGIP